jgi:hypothetical protein
VGGGQGKENGEGERGKFFHGNGLIGAYRAMLPRPPATSIMKRYVVHLIS